MRVDLELICIGAALLLQGCQTPSVSMTDFWHAQCARLGYEANSRKMTVCVSEMRDEAEADMFSAVANY